MSDHEYSIAGELPVAPTELLKQALESAGATLRVHDEIYLSWESPGVDVYFNAVLRAQAGMDYLITGTLELERPAACAWVQSLASALGRHGIGYRLELDDPADLEGEPLLTLSDPRFQP
jgi:hypothetical protein